MSQRGNTIGGVRTLALGAVSLAFAACSEVPTSANAPAAVVAAAPKSAGGPTPGAIYTRFGSCEAQQNANHFPVGHRLIIAGQPASGGAGTIAWTISGVSGAEPGVTVASGTISFNANGVATNATGTLLPNTGVISPFQVGNSKNGFCFEAYIINADDGGVYKAAMSSKSDNYSVRGIIELSKTASIDEWLRSWDWTIEKAVSRSLIDLWVGESESVDFTVSVTKAFVGDSMDVSGAVYANNTHPTTAALVDVVDCLQLYANGTWTDLGNNYCRTLATALSPGVNTLPYSFTRVPFDSAGVYRNRVTVTARGTTGNSLEAVTAAFGLSDGPTTQRNASVDVTDTDGPGWSFSNTGSETFSHTFSCTEPGNWTTTHAASIVEPAQSSSASVAKLCSARSPFQVSDGCTLSQGYWRTHSARGPSASNTVWNNLGGSGATFLHAVTYYDAMWTSGGNPWYTLARQYIAARLNGLNGANTGAVAAELVSALNLLANYSPATTGQMSGSNSVRQQFVSVAATLESYNVGQLGVSHCSSVG